MPLRFMLSAYLAYLLTLAPLPLHAGEKQGKHGKSVQFNLYKGFDFSKGGYTLIGLFTGQRDNELANRLQNFYTDDPVVLQKIQRAWVAGGPAPAFACGKHYNLILQKDGEWLSTYFVNLNTGCGTIELPKRGSYWFQASHIADFENQFKKPVIEKKTFSSLSEARAYYHALPREEVFWRYDPEWLQYDGEFTATAECTAEEDTAFALVRDRRIESFKSGKRRTPAEQAADEATTAACGTRIEHEVRSAVGAEKTDIHVDAQSDETGHRTMSIKVKGSRAAFQALQHYTIAEQWKDYDPTVHIFWKAGKPVAK